ncbi:MAG: hypothetical protein KDD63_00680 [Bacteroidetes bacterium]|nr:hypothetical protein [Bacteroidota bacterium]MCB0850728.1 hypothetical protein [Bacteroidota bacterium]
MKHIILSVILLTGISWSNIFSQNIYSALHHNREEDFGETFPREVIEKNTFYNPSGIEINKNKKKLNDQKKLLIEERFNEEGKLEARLIFTYDSTGRHSLNRKFERWTSFGYVSETAFYEYDQNGFLTKVTDKADNGNIIQQTVLINNEKGNPVRLELYDGIGNLLGVETATYNYETNQAYTAVLNQDGGILSQDTMTISFAIKESSEDTYNEKGDLIKSKRYIYEYKYDDFGNWIVMKIYENVDDKKIRDRVFKRKLRY